MGGYAVLDRRPDQVMHQNVSCPTAEHHDVQTIEILGKYRWAQGVIVLYSALCPAKSPTGGMQRVFGHQVIKREGMNWQISSSHSYRVDQSQRTTEKLIEYGIDVSEGAAGDRYTILYGQFLSPKVATIEATFDNGQVLRADGTGKAFALIAAGATHVCDLRLIGADNQILQREDLRIPDPLTQPNRLVSQPRRSRSQCLQPLHRL